MKAYSCNVYCRGKAVNIIYSECVFVASVIQHAKCRIILPSVVCLVVQYFSTLSHERRNFLKSIFKHKICFPFLYNFCLKLLSFQEKFKELLT